MTETTPDTETQTTTTTPTKPNRVASTIAGTVVTLTQGAATIGTFDIYAIPSSVASTLALMGLRDFLIRADDPVAAFAKLVAGDLEEAAAAHEFHREFAHV